MYILRLKYKKENYMKFLSHLDMVRLMERSCRRAGLPLDFTQGFNPHPKINFAMPLSVGVSSICEVMEIDLTEKINVDDFINNQEQFFPEGITIIDGIYVEPGKSLMSQVKASEFEIEVNNFQLNEDEITIKLDEFLKEKEIIIEKINKNKKVTKKNIREGIISFSFVGKDEVKTKFKLEVNSGSVLNINPENVITKFLDFIGIDLNDRMIRISRTFLFKESNGKFVDIFMKGEL